jgi:hypothetical protein
VETKLQYIYMRNEVNKTIRLRGFSVGMTDGSDFFMYTVAMSSDCMIYIPSVKKIGFGMQVIFGLLPPQSERLRC